MIRAVEKILQHNSETPLWCVSPSPLSQPADCLESFTQKQETPLTGIGASVLFVAKRGQAQLDGPSLISAGEVAAHLAGRLSISADGTGQMFGYFPYIEGLPGRNGDDGHRRRGIRN
jgi:hypothetical protein